MQLARRIAQPCQDQDLRHYRPGNLFSSCRQRLFQKINQPNLPAQMQPDPGTTKSSLSLHRNPLQIDFDPLWFNIVEQSPLRNGRSTCRLLVNPQTSRSIHLSEVGYDALPRTTRGAIAFDQSPVAMTLSLLRAIAATQVHEPMLQITASFQVGWSSLQTRLHTQHNRHRALTMQTRMLGNLKLPRVFRMCPKNFQASPNCESWVRPPESSFPAIPAGFSSVVVNRRSNAYTSPALEPVGSVCARGS